MQDDNGNEQKRELLPATGRDFKKEPWLDKEPALPNQNGCEDIMQLTKPAPITARMVGSERRWRHPPQPQAKHSVAVEEINTQ